jgi:hypothetical protein
MYMKKWPKSSQTIVILLFVSGFGMTRSDTIRARSTRTRSCDISTAGRMKVRPSMRDHISAFREFHLSWQAAVGQGETSYHVDDASWYRMLEAIESNTNAFLAEHQINALDDL